MITYAGLYSPETLMSTVKTNRDTAASILNGLKNAMRRRGHRRPTQEIDDAVDLNEVDDLLEDLGSLEDMEDSSDAK